ncbi:MAG: hypothetical protein ACYDAO_05695 [Thermoplasmataceae archaeon]
MTSYNDAYLIWNSIIEQTLSAGRPLRFKKVMNNGKEIPSPKETQPTILVKNLGEIKGQIADWRASLNNSPAGFHAVEFQDHYETHIDSVDPLKDPLGHLVKDSPGTLVGVIAAIAIGGLLAYVFTREK